MKVRELIERLCEEDQDADVVIGLTDSDLLKYGFLKEYIIIGCVIGGCASTEDDIHYCDGDPDYCSNYKNIVELRHTELGD
jgi:hypothetical protein